MNNQMNSIERYGNLDGFRTICCLCIIGMHIQANANYQISGWIYDSFIPSWTQFVPMFLMISGFGMFCGYYEKIKNNDIDMNSFYSKRYKKILPFFMFLIFVDVVVEHSLASVIEGATEATLVFGLLPNNNPSVIGVAWTIGVIFLFYMLFPFCVFLCWNKKRAAVVLGVSIILSLFCSAYFFTERFVVDNFPSRHNFLYCAPFFVGGGYIYLCREHIKEFVFKYKWIMLFICIVLSGLYYTVPSTICGVEVVMAKNFVLFSMWLCYGISVESKVLNNKFMSFFSSISLELYLAQMVIYRLVEKAGLLYIFGNGWVSFLVMWVLIVIGLIVFIKIYKIGIANVFKFMNARLLNR